MESAEDSAGNELQNRAEFCGEAAPEQTFQEEGAYG